MKKLVFDPWVEHHYSQTHQRNEGDHWIHIKDAFWYFQNTVHRSRSYGWNTQANVYLFYKNDNSNSCQKAMHNRRWDNFTQAPQFEHSNNHL